jgi:uncharacterized membrane protein
MEKRKHPLKSIVFLIFLLFFFWVLLQFLAPVMLPSDSVPDLSGIVGVSDNDDVLKDMAFPWNVIYSFGDRLCHQKEERSLVLNGNQMPFCTRCTAIWIGLAIGLGFMVFYTIELNERFFVLILLSLVPLGIDGIGQLIGFWESTNLLRFLTGLPAGLLCGVAIALISDELRSLPFFQRFSCSEKPKN